MFQFRQEAETYVKIDTASYNLPKHREHLLIYFFVGKSANLAEISEAQSAPS